MTDTTSGQPTPPSHPGEWRVDQIINALSHPLPKSVLESKKVAGVDIVYIPWYEANRILDKFAPGWQWEIRSIHNTHDRLFLVGRLTIPTCEGDIYREATGTELLKEEKSVLVGEQRVKESREIAYGDPSSNAESMAFRRAAARFGLGLYLYDGDADTDSQDVKPQAIKKTVLTPKPRPTEGVDVTAQLRFLNDLHEHTGLDKKLILNICFTVLGRQVNLKQEALPAEILVQVRDQAFIEYGWGIDPPIFNARQHCSNSYFKMLDGLAEKGLAATTSVWCAWREKLESKITAGH